MKKVKAMILGTTLALTSLGSFAAEQFSTIKVFKSPNCGCCSAWIKHLEGSGFVVESQNVTDINSYKTKANLPSGLTACHTAFVDGYAIEGHVPASDIRRMLTQKPEIRGLAVPGMPMGSPGMDYGDRKDAYQTISYTKDGKTSVFASH